LFACDVLNQWQVEQAVRMLVG